MRAPRLLLLALLALALGSSAQRAVLGVGGGGVGGDAAAAGGAAGSGAVASAPSDSPMANLLRSALVAPEQRGEQLVGEQAGGGGSAAAAGEAQPTEEELAAAALFQHPLAPPEQQRNWRAGAQTHVEMQRWLRRFFASDSSRLTSTRLQAAQTAAAVGGGRGPLPLQVGEAGDVLATAGGHPCNATCARRAAEELLLAGEAPGHGYMPLVWPQFPEDRRRWAAVRAPGKDSAGGTSEPAAANEGSPAAANSSTAAAAVSSSSGGGMATDSSAATAADSNAARATDTAAASDPAPSCLPRRPGEAISRDYLVVAAVGNNLTTVNRWGAAQCSTV